MHGSAAQSTLAAVAAASGWTARPARLRVPAGCAYHLLPSSPRVATFLEWEMYTPIARPALPRAPHATARDHQPWT
jgi:hypothetical protein